MADAPPPSAPLSPATVREDEAPRPIGNLRMVWDFASAYPGRIAIATLALATAAGATLAIPAGLKRIVDDGFKGGSSDIAPYFHYLFMIVGVLALATAIRFYFVSWIGERVVADIREAVQRNLLRLAPAFFEENRPSEISSRMTGTTVLLPSSSSITSLYIRHPKALRPRIADASNGATRKLAHATIHSVSITQNPTTINAFIKTGSNDPGHFVVGKVIEKRGTCPSP